MNLIYHELNRLIDDYYKCLCQITKKEILNDIKLLTAAVCAEEN